MPQRYYDELLRYFLREVRDPHEAQDLVQQVFERVLAMRHAGTHIGEPRALLYQAARNLLVDRHRFNQLRQHVGDDELASLPGPPSGEPDAVYASAQRARVLVAAIEALPPRCREAFVLHKIDGLRHADVAQRMGVTLNMVERHVMLAVATCRKALAGMDAALPARRNTAASQAETAREQVPDQAR